MILPTCKTSSPGAQQDERPIVQMIDNDKVNILVVDDLPEKLLVMETILEELGQNIVTASSGEEALRKVLEHDFAVILLDVNMPGMDGFETAGFIRKRKKSAHTPIIFITAFADEIHAAQGYSLGAVDYILAPVVPEILRTKVKVFVDLFQMAEQVRRQADERVALAQEQAARAAAEEATRRSNFLAEASTQLSSSLNFEATLRLLSRLVVPFLSDLGAVIQVDEGGRPGPIELAWLGSDQNIHSLSSTNREGLHGPLAMAIDHVIQSGKARILTEQGTWPAMSQDSEGNGATPDFALQYVVLLPLSARGRTLGVLTLGRKGDKPGFHGGDLALAEDLAGRAATAMDNARLYQNIQEGDRRKNEFLAMLAHELRNPLAPIRNAVQVLRMLGLQEPLLVQARDMIDRQVTHMARLIDDLLDMSRLSRGKILLKLERVDLVEVVRAAGEDYRRLLEANGLKVKVTLPDAPIPVHGDPVRLSQVMGNILHNANKFTDTGGEVLITLLRDEAKQSAVLRIRDTGIGMEAEMLARAFETFSQADSSLERSRGGLGLGLALVKGLIDLHGGTVRAHSEGPGKGTEVTITVPIDDRPETPKATPVMHGEETAVPRVLVIEDSPDTAESMRMLLNLSGYPVDVALSGAEGLDMARSFRPDVVLCDIGLPGGMDGYAVARAFREDPNFSSILLVALTGYGQEEDRRRSKESGFDAHLTKPMDFAELQQLLTGIPTGNR
jgi:signal transduction histidine kinase/DNA-binding response OmpR family regulator